MAEKMNRHLSGYSDDELRTVLGFMRAGRTAADEEIARVREQGITHATRRRPAAAVPQLSGGGHGLDLGVRSGVIPMAASRG
jgi:hypothetical protein